MATLKHGDHMHFNDSEHPLVCNENLSFSVYRENEHHVELVLRVPGLVPKDGLWFRVTNFCKTFRQPHELLGNGRVKRWAITNNSLELAIELANKKNIPYVLYSAKIAELPSPIDYKTVSVQVRKLKNQQKSFIIIRLNKQAEALIWMAFNREHGTLDAAIAKEELKSRDNENHA